MLRLLFITICACRADASSECPVGTVCTNSLIQHASRPHTSLDATKIEEDDALNASGETVEVVDSGVSLIGQTIALYSPVWKRFVQMTPAAQIDSGNECEIDAMPGNFSWTHFEVHHAGGDMISLWSTEFNRFLKMDVQIMTGSLHKELDSLPEDWEDDCKFRMVHAGRGKLGNGLVGLWSPTHKKFMRMDDRLVMDVSNTEMENPDLTDDLEWERFNVLRIQLPTPFPTPPIMKDVPESGFEADPDETNVKYIVDWKIESSFHRGNNVCGVVEDEVEHSSVLDESLIGDQGIETREWTDYFWTGHLETGCKPSCNEGKGVDLSSHYAMECNSVGYEDVYAYAKTYIHSDEEVSRNMFFGCSDGCLAWLNGDLIVNATKHCHTMEPSEYQSPVDLKIGRNALVVKVGKHTGCWSFIAYIDDDKYLKASRFY